MEAQQIEDLAHALEQAVPVLGDAFRLACDGYPRTARAWILRSRKNLRLAVAILDWVIDQEDKKRKGRGGDATGTKPG